MSKILKGLTESTHNKYDNNRTGFSRGPRDDERHDLDVQKPAREEWALKINGKVWSKDGKTVTFTSKEKALKARQSLLAKRPELEVGLVTRNVSEAGTGLDIDRSIPGRTIARISGDIKHRTGSPSGKKLPDYHPDDDYDQWSGKTSASIGDDEEDTFDKYYMGDEEDELKEISNQTLGQYKTAAASDAGKADKKGDYNRANKRFSGIVKATKKQFANDTKTVKEDINSVYAKAKSILKQLDESTQQQVIDTLKKSIDDEEQKPFRTGYPRVNSPQILGTKNRAKSAYYPPAKPAVKKLDKPLPESLGDELKSKSIQALHQVKQQLEQQRMADLEQWEKDFKQNTVAKFTAREPNLRQRVTSTPTVAMPGEKHSVLKSRLVQLDKAIEKQGILDNLVQRLDKKGLLTPNIEAGVNTSMLVRDGARDNYVELNKKLDKALEYVKNRLLTNKAAFAKPKAIDEDDGVPTRMRMNDYLDLADTIQEKLRQAIKIGDRARIEELNKQRDELDAHVKKHGMMPEDVEDLDENLHKWFKEKWVRFGPDGKIRGDCARGSDSEGKPKCLPQSKAQNLGKKGRASAAARKRREDPNPERSGKAINVNTKKKTNEEELDEACWKGYHKEGMKTMFGKQYPNCVKNKKSNEDIEESDLDEAKRKKKSKKKSSARGYFFPGYGYYGGSGDSGESGGGDGGGESKGSAMSEADRIARKPGQPANSKKHSDLYTDENPKGTITGLKFATAEDARASVSKIRNSGRSHAHKIQAAVAMEQRAKAAGKSEAASVYRKYINSTKKTNEEGVAESQHSESCPHCGGEMVSEELMNEKKDACYYKVKSRYKVWPSAYASGALVKCRKKGASNWGTGGKSNESVKEAQLDEKWTKKYKDSINCSNPKGFSQKAHCAGKQKNESSIMQGLNHLDEGWKEKLGAAALTGAMALGAAGASADTRRVTPDGQGGFTGGMKPTATVVAPDNIKPASSSDTSDPFKGLVRADSADRQAKTITVAGKEYRLVEISPTDMRPRGGQQIIVPQAVLGERSIGNYMGILAGNTVYVISK